MTHKALDALRRPFDVENPDFELMQQLFNAGIRKCPLSGMPVFDPSACTPQLRATLWRHYCGLATTINTKELGQTDESLEDLQTQLHEHANAALPVTRQAKRARSPSHQASDADDAETDTGELQRRRGKVPTTSEDDE